MFFLKIKLFFFVKNLLLKLQNLALIFQKMLSQLLFNVYNEAIFQRALSDSIEGLSRNEEILNNLRVAERNTCEYIL